MGLKHLKRKVEKVEVSDDESFEVRALSFSDISVLYEKYATEVSGFFTLLTRGKDTTAVDVESAAMMAADFIRKAPALAAETIALACGGEEGDFEIAMTLPFPVQLDAIKKIGKCTFGSDGSGKKFYQTIQMLMGQVQPESPSR